MQVWKWVLLFKIFVSTYGQNVQINDKERSVNLALETVLEFNNRDNSADIQFLDNVQRFITKVRGVIDKNKVSRRDFKSNKNATLTDFIQNVVSILNTFDQPDFQDVFDILDDEVRKYHYRGCKFYELTENFEIRRLLASKLDVIRGQPIAIVRGVVNGLAKILREEKYDKNVKELIDYINSLYRHDALEKFNKVLTNLKEFNKSKIKKSVDDLVKIIRDGIRSIIFDHYTALNPNARRELKSKIEALLKHYKQPNNTKPNTKETVKADKKSENINTDTIQAVKKIEPNTLKVLTTKDDANNFGKEETDDEDRDEPVGDESDKHNEGRVATHPIEEKIKPIEREKINENELDKNSDVQDSHTDGSKNYNSDSKKVGNMRGGKDDVKTSFEKSRAWVPRYTKLDSNLIDPPEEFEVTVKKVPRSNTRATKRHYRTGRTFSSYEKISEDVGTVEDNSVEFHAEEMTTTRQRTQTSELPRFITLWEETATGGIPQYMLNRFTTKRHHSSHKKHKYKHKERKTHKPKKHKTHEKHRKHEKYKDYHHKDKLRSGKKKRWPILISEHNADIAVRSTAMEYYEYKKMLEPVKIARMESDNWPEGYIQVPSPRGSIRNSRPESTLKNTPKTTSRATTTPTRRNTRRPPSSTQQKFAKRYEVLPISSLRDFRKAGPMSREAKSVENFRKKDKKRTRKSYNETATVVVDQNVIKRIKDLEREIKEVKSKIGDRNIGKVNNNKDKDKKVDLKDKRRMKLVKISAPEDKKSKIKKIPDKEHEYKSEIKVNAVHLNATTKTKTTEKVETTTRETRTTGNPIVVIQRKTDAPEKLVKDQKRDEGTVRLVNQDIPNPIHTYDEIDEWKDALKINSKNVIIKSTSKSSTITTTTTTTSSTATPKPTETVPPSSSKVEIFIPIPSTKITTPKTTTTKKVETTTDKHIPFVAQSSKSKIQNSKSPMQVSPFAASNVFNFSDTINTRENLHNEVSFILKKNNISVPTDKPDIFITNLNDNALPYSRLPKEIEFTPGFDDFNFGNNTLGTGLIFTDPFRNIDDELEFLKV